MWIACAEVSVLSQVVGNDDIAWPLFRVVRLPANRVVVGVALKIGWLFQVVLIPELFSCVEVSNDVSAAEMEVGKLTHTKLVGVT